ncbi:MAG: nucleotidyltransferase family protein [Deltaproteobacteria bacterium]|nr:nucleotidyltransferase family protein [Deltaproteobacteria bacterium]
MRDEWKRSLIVRLDSPGFRLLRDLILASGPKTGPGSNSISATFSARSNNKGTSSERPSDPTMARSKGTFWAPSRPSPSPSGRSFESDTGERLSPRGGSHKGWDAKREDPDALAWQLGHTAMDTWLGAWLWSLLRRLPQRQGGAPVAGPAAFSDFPPALTGSGFVSSVSGISNFSIGSIGPSTAGAGSPAGLLAGLGLAFGDDLVVWLQREYHASLARNIMLLQATEAAEAALRNANLRPVRLKGMALLGSEYPDLGGRPMVDADLYVDRRQLHVAASVLSGEGWHMTKENAASALLPGHHLHFTRTKPFAATLELHYRFNLWWWGAEPEPDFVLDEAEPLDLHLGDHGEQAGRLRQGEGALRPGPELLVTHLAMHFLKHGLGPDLRNLVDIHLVTQSPNFDWDRLLSVARQGHAAVPVASVLLWAHRSMGIPASLPDSLISFVDGNRGIDGDLAKSALDLLHPVRGVSHRLDLRHRGRAVSHRMALRLVPRDEIPPGPGIAARLHILGHVPHQRRGNMESVSSAPLVGGDHGPIEARGMRDESGQASNGHHRGDAFSSSATLALTHAFFLGSPSRAAAALLSYVWNVAGRKWVNRVLGLWKRR